MEKLGFEIFILVVDNISINVTLQNDDGGSTPVASHIHDKRRILLCWIDYCHVLMCLKNLWPKRDFIVNCKNVSFNTIFNIFSTFSNTFNTFKNIDRWICCGLLASCQGGTNNLERQKVMWAFAVSCPKITFIKLQTPLFLFQKLRAPRRHHPDTFQGLKHEFV